MTRPDPALSAAFADRYVIERELGQGGMATVYLAHDLKHDRDVAIKLLHEHRAAELGAERFLSEIRTTAKLRHPNILPLFDSGAIADGSRTLMYYVMPHIDGESLRNRMTRERRIPLDDALRIIRELAGALGYAHEQGVIHRDIKPENVLLERGHALLADFGIALAGGRPGAERITQVGMALGTPAYMSPEQAAGDRDIDARSDLYSLASVLFEMLSGQPPFTGPTVESVLVQRFTKAPPRLSATIPSLARHVDAAVYVAMARDPAERFATMERFVEALSPPAPVGGDAKAPSSIAVLPFANMSTDPENEYFSDGIAEEIINALTQLPGLHVAARTSAFSFKGKNQDLRDIATALNVTTILEGSVRKTGNRVRVTAQLINAADGYHLWSQRYDRELTDIFAIQDEIALAIAEKLRVTLAPGQAEQLVKPPTSVVAAYEMFLKARRLVRLRGRYVADALECYEQAIALDPKYAEPQAGLALALILTAFWGVLRPKDIAARARAAAERALSLNPSLVDAQAAAALVASMVDFDVRRSIAIWDAFPPLDPASVDAHVMRASFDRCYIRGDFDLGISELRAAVAADPLNAYPLAQLSIVLGFARRYEEARIEGERAMQLDAGSTYVHWAVIHAAVLAGDATAARRAFDVAVARFGRGPWFLMALACSLRSEADHSVAEAILDELSARARLEYVQPAVLGAVATAAGKWATAVEYFAAAAIDRDPLFLAVARNWPPLDPIRSRPEWPHILAQLDVKSAA
jgi:serine/threonine-protein kinase